MLGHLGINVTDLAAARIYYAALMPLVGFEPFLDDDDQFAFRPAADRPGTYCMSRNSFRNTRLPTLRRSGSTHSA
ncbi:hypothetical protein MHPYR_40091 [uncultured Mycobacterium sp.]|uniref:Uncharacterized protein n=1 Tax=uncultured Mycobacterium sp. TaxID=171292 RepID=A0A1Y5PIF7_9MYCO|nr:hypothetical protein MHPYR_40091 [uncultured Mycobacterium sp.]